MAASGYTPIILFNSTTTGNTPTTSNLAVGELAINVTDGKLFFNQSGTIKVLANATYATSVSTISFGTTGLTPSTATNGVVTVAGTLATTNGGTGLTSFTSGGVVYASSTSALATGSALTFDGTNLGLGVTPSAWGTGSGGYKAINIGTYGAAYDYETSGAVGLASNCYATASNWIYTQSYGASRFESILGQHRWYNAPSGTAGNAITFTQAMTLDVNGNLLVGTTSATGGIIQAAGDIAVTYQPGGGQTAGFRMGPVGPSTQGMIGYDGSTGNLDISPRDGYAIVFKTKEQGTERARIDSSGNLLVGTTSANGRLTVTAGSAAQSPIATSSVSGDTTYQAILVSKFDNNSTTSQNFIQFQINNGGANCGKITANGANTAAFGSTSDQRVKENIVELPSQLANIMALRPVEYDYLESYGGGHQIGFIAQEMRQVYPDVIAEDDTDEKILSITGWSKTEARLVKAIQEQQALITAQSATIQSLTARLTALENK